MNNLTIFIVKTYKEGVDPTRTAVSFGEVANDFVVVDSLFEVNELYRGEGWFGVFYEDEIITDELLVALDDFFTYTKADVLVCFKKENSGKVTKCPRFFRSHVDLDIACLAPEDRTLQHEIILNGVIKEND